MAFRAYLVFVALLYVPLAAKAGYGSRCGDAFEKMFPAEIHRAAHLTANIQFLPSGRLAQVRRVALGLAYGQEKDIFPRFEELREVVNFLQQERRLRFRRIANLRDVRRRERDLIRQGSEDENKISARRQAKNSLDEEIAGAQAELDALTSHLVPLRNQLGRMTIEAAATAAAKDTDTLIVLRNTLINAAGQLAHKGVGKGLSVKFHAASEGVIAGLIPYQQRLSSKVAAKGPAEVARLQKLVDEALADGEVIKIKFRVGTLAAVEREGDVKFVNIAQESVSDDQIVELIGVLDEGSEPRLLVSDVDPLAFGRRAGLPAETPVDSPLRGIATPTEIEVIEAYNRRASALLDRRKGTFMAHGAENRNPNSSGISGYPITAHFPDGRTRVIGEGPDADPDFYLKKFYAEAAAEGFRLDVNPRWGWPAPLP